MIIIIIIIIIARACKFKKEMCEHAAKENENTQTKTKGCEECERERRTDWDAL
jgi:hypothetical protein